MLNVFKLFSIILPFFINMILPIYSAQGDKFRNETDNIFEREINLISNNHYFKQSLILNAKVFLEELLTLTNSTQNDSCIISDDSYYDVFKYSFTPENIFGEFYQCIKMNNMSYYYFLFINSNLTKARNDTHLSHYFKDLIFYDYFSFAMCLPDCVYVNDNIMVNITDSFMDIKGQAKLSLSLSTEYIFRSYDVTSIENKENSFWYIFSILISVFSIFLILSIFFSIFPNLRKLYYCFCRKKYEKIFIKDLNTINRAKSLSPTNSEMILKSKAKGKEKLLSDYEFYKAEQEQEIIFKIKEHRYKIFSSIFNISKNIIRLTRVTNKHSCYINDNSVNFMNGVRAITLLILIFCSIFWIILELPISTINIEKLKIIMNNSFFFPVLYYMYTSLYIHFYI
jgi:hypothetical protein